MKKVIGLVLGLMLCVSNVWAQGVPGTLIQPSPTHLDVCTGINAKSTAVNTLATVTIPAISGQSIYLCGVSFEVTNSATGAVTQANVCFTTTNMGGIQWCYSSTNAANTSTTFIPTLPATYVKSGIPGTAVTIVSPAINAQIIYNINAYFYYAP